jgi:anti-anti-sigma regulatory factor
MRFDVFTAKGEVPVTVIRPQGELDASNYQDLIEEAREACSAGAADILLDLSKVPYMSSSGLVALQSISALLRGDEAPDLEYGWAAFRAVHREVERDQQPHLKLLSPQPHVERVLEVSGLGRYLEAFSDLESAVRSFQPAAQ